MNINERKKLVSVIIPVYNVEKYLDECINSVLNQTYSNLEIILIDDGSTDKSGLICDQYKEKDKRIVVIHKTNGGLSDARNVGLNIAKGEYISFVDSDDYISQYFIEIMMNNLIENECELAALKSGTNFWDGEKFPELAINENSYNSCVVNNKTALEKMMYMEIETGAPFKVCKKEVLNNIRFPVGYYYEDVATTYKTFFNTSNIVIVDSNIYAYRKRKESIIRQEFSERKLSAIPIYEQLKNDENLLQLGLYDAAVSRAYSMLFSVYLQIPIDEKELRKNVWSILMKDRKTILRNKNARKKNKYAALISYVGMDITCFIGKKFGQNNSMN